MDDNGGDFRPEPEALLMLFTDPVSRSGEDVFIDPLVFDAEERARDLPSALASPPAASAWFVNPILCEDAVSRLVLTFFFDDTLLETVDSRLLASLLSGDCPKK